MIAWPDRQEQAKLSQDFQLASGLPGIIGAIDGCHIRLSSCPGGDNDYINIKGFPLNAASGTHRTWAFHEFLSFTIQFFL